MFNPIDALKAQALKEVEKVEAKIMAIDLNHNGLPDAVEAKKLLEEGFAELKLIESEISPAEMAAALNMLFPGKFDAAKIASAEAALDKLAKGLALAGALAAQVPQAVK